MSKYFLINGSSKKNISPFDRAFQYGDGIFRTFVVENFKPQHWKQQYKKIADDCRALKIKPPKEKELLSDIQRLFRTRKKAVGKFIISRGISERGYKYSDLIKPNRYLIKVKMPIYPDSYFHSGINLHVCKQKLHSSLLFGIKHLNRLENIMARQEWKSDKYLDGILLDQSENVIECISSNIFMRIGNIIYTPELKGIGIKGVTRGLVIKALKKLGFQIKESTFNLNKLLKAEEVFITSSLFGALQVAKIRKRSWPRQELSSRLRQSLESLNK